MSSKRRKAMLKELLQDTPLDPEGDGEDGSAMGCGPRDGRGPSGGPRRRAPLTTSASARPHLAVMWDATAGQRTDNGESCTRTSAAEQSESESSSAEGIKTTKTTTPTTQTALGRWYLVRPLGVEAAVERVRSLAQPSIGATHPLGEGKVTPIRPELAWILTNLAAVQPGALVLDPFVGTGSVLLPSLALGAPFALGLDIADPHPSTTAARMESAGDGSGALSEEVGATANQAEEMDTGMGGVIAEESGRRYGDDGSDGGEASLGVDTTVAAAAAAKQRGHDHVRANARRLPFNTAARGGFFDAIICDPPYGLRKPRMLSEGVKDDTFGDMDQMQDAVTAILVGARTIRRKCTLGGVMLVV